MPKGADTAAVDTAAVAMKVTAVSMAVAMRATEGIMAKVMKGIMANTAKAVTGKTVTGTMAATMKITTMGATIIIAARNITAYPRVIPLSRIAGWITITGMAHIIQNGIMNMWSLRRLSGRSFRLSLRGAR